MSTGPLTQPGAAGGDSISVAMATFNGLAFLAEQLDSIRSQSRSADEIIAC